MLQISREQVLRAQSESIEYGKRSVSIHFFSLGLWSVFKTLLALKIILAFTKMRFVQLQKSLRMKKIFACRNPKPSVARRCTLPAVERTQGTQFCQGEQNACFGLGLGLGKVRGMFCFGVSLSLGLGLSFAKVWKSFGHSL